MNSKRVAIEHNGVIVPNIKYKKKFLKNNDIIEIVILLEEDNEQKYLKISNLKLKSRLIVGTGKYKSFQETAKAVKESGAEMVTVAVRRINILDKKKPILTDYLDPKKIIFLPNTAELLFF